MVKNDRYSAPIIKNVSGPLLNHKKRLRLNRNLASLLSISLCQCLLFCLILRFQKSSPELSHIT